MSANVRFSNYTPLGPNGFILNPFNGKEIRVYNPLFSVIDTVDISNSGITGVVSSCFINDLPNQNMPYNIPHVAFLKLDINGNPYINWLSWPNAGTTLSSEGYKTDLATQKGHLVGMAIRMPNFEIQGQANSQFLVSYYNRGQCSWVSIPAGLVNAGWGWMPVGVPVQLLIWEDDWPVVVAALNMTGSVSGASLQAAIGLLDINGDLISMTYGAAYNQVASNPYMATLTFPGNPINPGFYSYQVYLTCNEGSVSLGAALNSTLNVNGKF